MLENGMMKQKLRGTFTLQLFASHVLVAVLTGIGVTALAFALIAEGTRNPTLDTYKTVAYQYGAMWLAGEPDGAPTDLTVDPMPGWTLIVSDEGVVLWSRGDTPCRAGMVARACAPEPAGETRFFEVNGERWAEVIEPLVTGQYIHMQRGRITAEPTAVYGNFIIRGYSDLFIYEVLSRGLMAVPTALLLAWLITRPQIRRLVAITQASRRFAEGDLQARIGDHRQDDIGRLAQQFDDMAGALAQNIQALQDLGQRNAELAVQAEETAIKAERIRISRDLHDAIAQRLFSLSVSTTMLPDVIAQNPGRGIQQAKTVAELAEQTLLDLRTLLVELRPTNVIQHGLAESLKALFREWETLHPARIEPALMLMGGHIPAAIEDAVYQITQEALSNVARHAQATLVEISLVEGQKQLMLSISDNGRGFDLGGMQNGAKFGLVSMRERAQMFGGMLSVESETGKGTTIAVTLPLGEQTAGVRSLAGMQDSMNE
jgi:signal transduction histidine kinase